MNKILTIAACCTVFGAVVSGCAPLVVGGAAVATGTTVSTMVDRRSTGAQVNDTVLEKRVAWEISQALGQGVESHITVTAYNGRVLLTGEIQTEQAKQLATETAQKSLDVAGVVNELAVQENAGIMQRMSDSSLATKVRSRMVATDNVYLSQMKIVVERGIVYIMGLVTPQENTLALVTAAKTSGVVRVISYCEIMSAERIQQMLRDMQEQNAATQQAPAAGTDAGTDAGTSPTTVNPQELAL